MSNPLVRAKFYVASVEGHANNEQRIVRMLPVQAKEGEDSIFGKWTPSGEIKMAIMNPAASTVFEQMIGKKFYVDFTPAQE